MGRFAHLVDSLAEMEGFRAKYHIPQGVSLRYCAPDQLLTHRNEGEVVIPMIAFIKEGMTLPMGRVTRDYLIAHRLCPYQCASNLFRILGSIDALNDQMGAKPHLARRCLDVECHQLVDLGFYLKSRSSIIRLVSCLPKSNKGMKDDFLMVLGEWHNGLYCPVWEGEPGRVP